jgi:hypothetical protein
MNPNPARAGRSRFLKKNGISTGDCLEEPVFPGEPDRPGPAGKKTAVTSRRAGRHPVKKDP